ncbi:MAG: hypothetical protein ACFFEY_14130 [Candidatus Thorarchaeota archaeon]
MSKIPKEPTRKTKIKAKDQTDDNYAFKSVIISAVIGFIFFIISLLFNAEIVTIFMNNGIIFTVIDISIKVVAILLFFLFIITSYGNYKELIGKPLNWKHLLIIFLLSIGQTILNIWVFALTLFGLVVILVYLFLVQEF